MDEVRKKLECTSKQICRVQELCNGSKTIEGSTKLLNKIKAEKKFLEKLEAGKKSIDAAHVSSSNLKNLNAILDAIDCVGFEHIKRILYVVDCYDSYRKISHSLTVDLVANSGHTWIKVIARKPSALLANACGKGEFGRRSLLDIGKMYLLAAKQNPKDYLKPYVVFYFADGVPNVLAKSLVNMGIIVNGKVHLSDDNITIDAFEEESSDEENQSNSNTLSTEHKSSYQDHRTVEQNQNSDDLASLIAQTKLLSTKCCDLNEVVHNIHALRISSETNPKSLSHANNHELIDEANLDVTAMLTLVSNLSNGSVNCRFDTKVLNDHAAQERKTPVLPSLKSVLDNKKLIACETAISAFNNIVDTIGGPQETKRAEELLQRITVVPDCPSERCLRLPESSKINKRALIIFGTGDERKALTVTANSGFIRAASQSGVKLTTYEHQARALTEKKELVNI